MNTLSDLFPKARAEILRLLFSGGSQEIHLRDLARLAGLRRNDDADYLDTCRAKRNTAEYDTAGTVSPSEAAELRAFAQELRADVIAWLKAIHPTLITAH
jgi:hypothetical protein